MEHQALRSSRYSSGHRRQQRGHHPQRSPALEQAQPSLWITLAACLAHLYVIASSASPSSAPWRSGVGGGDGDLDRLVNRPRVRFEHPTPPGLRPDRGTGPAPPTPTVLVDGGDGRTRLSVCTERSRRRGLEVFGNRNLSPPCERKAVCAHERAPARGHDGPI